MVYQLPISVVIPMYDSAETISRAIESVRIQDFDDWELIVVDDGSTDNSAELVSTIAKDDERIRLETLGQNLGHGPARNAGINAAEGRYIVFLDADDALLPGSLREINTGSAPGHDLLFIGSRELRRNQARSLNAGPMLRQLSTTPGGWSVSDHPELLFWPPATWSKVYRRDFLRDHEIRFPTGFHQDIPWSVETTLKANLISGLDYECYEYRRPAPGGSSTTMSKGTKTLERVRQVQRVRELFRVNQLPENIQVHLVALMAVHLIWGNRAAYRTMPDELREQFFHDSSAELHWWFELAKPDKKILSEPLMPTQEREFFSVALLSDSFRLWQQALDTHRKKLRWQRRFDLSRYRVFKR